MGSWTLEVFKLGLYVTFPVAMFYIFNQPSLFETWVVQKKRELYPPESRESQQEVRAFIKDIKDKQQAELIKQLEQEELLFKSNR